MLMIIPLPWALSWILAAIWHELFHCFALLLCRKHIQGIVIGIKGAEIKTGLLTDMESFICAVAGPLGGFSLLLLSDVFPLLSVCGFMQSAFNLLPVYPLDGGRALRGFAGLITSERIARVLCNSVENLFMAFALILSLLFAFILRMGLVTLLVVACLIVHTKKIKIPCK